MIRIRVSVRLPLPHKSGSTALLLSYDTAATHVRGTHFNLSCVLLSPLFELSTQKHTASTVIRSPVNNEHFDFGFGFGLEDLERKSYASLPLQHRKLAHRKRNKRPYIYHANTWLSFSVVLHLASDAYYIKEDTMESNSSLFKALYGARLHIDSDR